MFCVQYVVVSIAIKYKAIKFFDYSMEQRQSVC